METPATDRTKRQTSHEFSKKLIKLTVAGGVAFWIVDFAISLSPISAEYMAAFSISSLPLALVDSFYWRSGYSVLRQLFLASFL